MILSEAISHQSILILITVIHVQLVVRGIIFEAVARSRKSCPRYTIYWDILTNF